MSFFLLVTYGLKLGEKMAHNDIRQLEVCDDVKKGKSEM